MNFEDVMDELKTRAATIEGIRAYELPMASPTVGSLIVGYPEQITYDVTYARGMDRMTLPLILLSGKPFDRSTRTQLAEWTAGAGPRSVKAVLESGAYTSLDDLRVTEVDLDVVTIGGVDLMAALFTLDIGGQGDPPS